MWILFLDPIQCKDVSDHFHLKLELYRELYGEREITLSPVTTMKKTGIKNFIRWKSVVFGPFYPNSKQIYLDGWHASNKKLLFLLKAQDIVIELKMILFGLFDSI